MIRNYLPDSALQKKRFRALSLLLNGQNASECPICSADFHVHYSLKIPGTSIVRAFLNCPSGHYHVTIELPHSVTDKSVI